MTQTTVSSVGQLVGGIVLLTIVLPSSVAAQNLRAMAREHAARNPGTTMEQPAPPGDYAPTTFEDLSKESDVVVQGKLVLIKSYLGASEDRVLTDYRLVAAKVIAGGFNPVSSPALGPGVPMTITVYGGEVQLEGVKVRGTDHNREPIVEGQDYLLFLRESRSEAAGQYEIYYAGIFETTGGHLKALLKRGDEVFEGSKNAGLEEIIARVQKAKRR